MKTKTRSLAIMLFVALFTSCSSEEDQIVVPTPAPSANGFTWSENGSNTVETAATASFSTQYKTLIAKDGANGTIFEINLAGSSASTYTVGPNNAVTFTGVNPYFVATGGSVIISSNANGKMSGTFETTGSSGGITAINGRFTNIDVNP